MYIIVLTGLPASGKSTIAKKLSAEFNLPLFEKDKIKEVLFDTLGFENYAQKRKLDYAANAILLSLCENMIKSKIPVILDNNFDKVSSEALSRMLLKYNCGFVPIVLTGDVDAFYHRYINRDNQHERHLGHILQDHYPPRENDCLDYQMTRAEFDEKFLTRGMAEFHCGGTQIEVDATDPDRIDTDALVAEIRKKINQINEKAS